MRKSMRTILLCALAIMMVFVSCSPTAENTEKLGKAILMTDGNARSLTVAEPSFNADDLYWKYATQKVDTTEFHTGQTATYDESGAVKVTEGKGLKGKVGPFSQGLWNFKLFAYSDAECTKLAWTGETLNQKIVAGDGNKVSVKVNTLQTENGTGTLAIGDILLKDGTSSHAAVSRDNLTQVITYWKEGTAEDQAISKSQAYPEWINEITDIPSGGYWVVVKYVDTAATDIVRGEEKKFVNIFDNVTTTIGGFISENTGSAIIDGENGHGEVKKASSSEVIVDDGSETAFEVDITPVALSPVNKTKVSIPMGTLASSDGNAKLAVTTYTAPKANDMFTVAEGSVAVAGIDLNLNQGGTAKDDFGDGLVTVTTYIAKGLIPGNIDVKYNGTKFTDQPVFVKNDLSINNESATGYNPVTGELRFQTNHFSQFYVVSSNLVAIDVKTDIGYSDLKKALSVVDGDIVLLSDVALAPYGAEFSAINVKAAKLSLSGHTITLNNLKFAVMGRELEIDGTEGGGIRSESTPQAEVLVDIYNGSTLNVNGGSYYSTGYAFAPSHSTGQTAANNMTLRNIEAHTKWGVVVVSGLDTNENNITLIDCVADEGGIGYLAGMQNTKVIGGSYRSTNGDAIVYQKVGALTLDNCKLSVGVKLTDAWKHNGNGSSSGPAAVIIEACGYPAKQPIVSIKENVVIEKAEGDYDILLIDYRPDEEHNYFRTYTDGIKKPYRFAEITAKTGVVVNISDANTIPVDTRWYNETEKNFSISNASELAGLSKLVSEGKDFYGKTITLTDDIDLSGIAWKPIGTIFRGGKAYDDFVHNGNTYPGANKEIFKGDFNGNNKKITGLTPINPSADDTVTGLFGVVGGYGSISNLTVESGTIQNGTAEKAGDTAAAIAGFTIPGEGETFTIVNCHVGANVNVTAFGSAEGTSVAGIVGKAYGTGTTEITRCTNAGTILNSGSCQGKAAGIIAMSNKGDLVIEECSNTGSIKDTGDNSLKGEHMAAGILAYSQRSVAISKCSNTGAVNSTRVAGGIVGCTSCSSTIDQIVLSIDSCTTSEENITPQNSGYANFPIIGKMGNSRLQLTINPPVEQ